MILVRENKEKHREVYFLKDRYRKYWFSKPPGWVKDHVQLLDSFFPSYILGYGDCWIDFKILDGILASTFPHTDEFILRIYNFCLNNIKETYPYAHGDWVLSNMLINNNFIQLCDWDNFGIYDFDEVIKKLHHDMYSAFGNKFNTVKREINDPSSI